MRSEMRTVSSKAYRAYGYFPIDDKPLGAILIATSFPRDASFEALDN